MSADELGSVWSSEPLRVTQSVRSLGKEHDSEKNEDEEQSETETQEREQDRFEPSSEKLDTSEESIQLNTHPEPEDLLIPGSKIDVIIG